MTIEEKAKAYDDAVNHARKTLDDLAEDYLCTHMTKDDVRYQYSQLFPELREDEDTMMNRKLIYGLQTLLNQGKETFAGADIEDLLDYFERKSTEDKPKEVFHPTLEEIKALDTVFFAADCKRLGVEDTLLNFRKKMSALYRGPKINGEPITMENNAVNIQTDNRLTFTEGEVKVIKDIIGYLDYKGMEAYHDSLENLMLKYGGNEQ